MQRKELKVKASGASVPFTPLKNGVTRTPGAKVCTRAWEFLNQLLRWHRSKLVLRRHLVVSGRTAGRSGLQSLQGSILQLRKPFR